jgi:hypothetical protein
MEMRYTMAHPLDGARLKIVRAKQHLESFNEEAGRYIDANPPKVVTKVEGDCISVEGVITSEPPPPFACIVGDFVTNLRASLDYIVWELTVLAGRSLSVGQMRKVTFPIATDQASFTKANGTADHLSRICGIPAAAMSVIESVQPYHAGYEAMGALDSLVRTDKHRTLLLCASLVENIGGYSIYCRDELIETGVSDGLVRMKINLATRGESLAGTTSEDYRMKMDGKPTIFVSLKDFPSPGETTNTRILQKILECVANIVPRFDVFFK